MEFAVVGVAPATLAGSHPLQPWGQEPEVLAGFPATEGDAGSVGGRGEGDGSFVQGLGDFCFPCGANLTLVNGAEVWGFRWSLVSSGREGGSSLQDDIIDGKR